MALWATVAAYAFSVLAASASSAGATVLPQVTFVHARLLESYCAQASAAKPDPVAVAEVNRRLPEFQAAWDKDGRVLMQATMDVSGQPYRFSRREYDLHACPDMGSLSSPPVLAVARYTQAAGAGAESGLVRRAVDAGVPWEKLPPKPMSDFVYTVWHELAHRHVIDALGFEPGGRAPRSTPLLDKYAAESTTVRWHLHLFAIEKLALRKLGREAEYRARYEGLKASGYTNYIRARDIVEKEGAETFVAELRARGSPPAADPLATVKEELRAFAVEQNRARQARDRAALERLYADEFVFVHAFGYADDKETVIRETLEEKNPPVLPAPSFEPPGSLHASGDLAILRNPNGGTALGTRAWSTSIYLRRDGRWQLLQRQGTEMVPAPKLVTVASEALPAYQGAYRTSRGDALSVEQRGSSLWIVSERFPPRELMPIGPDLFTTKLGGEFRFTRDGQGRVTGYASKGRAGETTATR